MSKTIGIIGCGWLGLPLAKELVAAEYTIYGTTTSDLKLEELRSAGITPFKIILNSHNIDGPITDFLARLKTLIINVPPRLRGGKKENYVQKMNLLFQEISASEIQNIVFVSSTSVYGSIEGDVTEDTVAMPNTESGKQLLASEEIFRKAEKLNASILRFGGLIGPERHPISFLSGRHHLENGEDVVNLIHLNDCISIICFILKNQLWNETFNGVYPDHPKKKHYYTSEALKRGLSLPQYVLKNTKYKGKQVISRNILNKKYCFSTPLSP